MSAHFEKVRRGRSIRRRKLSSLRCTGAAALAVAALLIGSPAAAHVIEIDPEGTISIRAGAGEAVWERLDSAVQSTTAGVDSAAVPSHAQAVTTLSGPMVPERYSGILHRAAEAANISPKLLAALVWQESRWNPRAVSPKGAIGLAQLMPGTARELGVDPRDPAENLAGGARYLRQLLNEFDGNVEKALAGYNAGPGRVRRANGIPPIRETRNYVRAIVARLSNVTSGGL